MKGSTVDDFLLDKGLPASPETERALLGALLLDSGHIYEVAGKLSPQDFFLDGHRRILEHLIAMSEAGVPIDTISLMERLKSARELEAIGGAGYLSSLTNDVPRRSSLAYHCRIVKEKARLRRLVDLGNTLVSEALDGDAKSQAVAANAQESLLALNATGSELRHIADVMAQAVDKLREYRNLPDNNGCLGISTTLESVDLGTTGIRDSELWVIGARPNVGKTPLGMQIGISTARHDMPVLVFSLEMRDTQLACRCISHAGIAKPRYVRDPRFSDAIWPNIEQAPEVVRPWPMWIDDTPGLSIRELRHKARYAVAKHGIRLIVVDYLQLIQAPGKGEYERVTNATTGLRLLARETTCPILALSQLNREAKDLSKEPTLGDLRSTGEIEQSANVVGLLHRPPERDSSETLGTNGVLIMAKIREGIGGKVNIHFDANTLTFGEGLR